MFIFHPQFFGREVVVDSDERHQVRWHTILHVTNTCVNTGEGQFDLTESSDVDSDTCGSHRHKRFIGRASTINRSLGASFRFFHHIAHPEGVTASFLATFIVAK